MNDYQQWKKIVSAACAEAKIAVEQIEPIRLWTQKRPGSSITFQNSAIRLGRRRIIKLYGPGKEKQYHIERTMLEMLATVPDIPTPDLLAAGYPEGQPPYIIMREVEGESLEAAWEKLTRDQLLTVAAEIGRITAVLHQLPIKRLAGIEQQLGGRQKEFASEKAERLAELETSSLSLAQKQKVGHFLEGEAWQYVNDSLVLNHYDLSHAHIFVRRGAGQPVVSGIIDWADAMCGPPEWDLVYHWFWTFSTDREAMRVCLEAYYENGRLPTQLPRRCLSALCYSFSMQLLWPELSTHLQDVDNIIEKMVELSFPAEVFDSFGQMVA